MNNKKFVFEVVLMFWIKIDINKNILNVFVYEFI